MVPGALFGNSAPGIACDGNAGERQEPENSGRPPRRCQETHDIEERVRIVRGHGVCLGSMVAGRLVPSRAIRTKVSTIRQLALIVPPMLPDTLDTPPVRRRCATGISRMRSPARAVRICI